MRTVEQTADELVEKFIQAQDNTKFETSDENYRKCQSLNEELGSEVDVYWQRLAIQCAINAIDYTIKCLEDGFSNAPHFDDEIEFQQQVKQELETRLNK